MLAAQEPAITLATGLPAPAVVAAAVLLLFLPGYAVAALLLPGPHYRALERLLAAPVLTVALLALLTLWATTLGVPLGRPTAILVLAAAAAVVAGEAGRGALRRRCALGPWVRGEGAVAAAYLGLFGLALALRLWSTRSVLPTLGADTYHHTLIARLLVERGGLPTSYEPYAAIHSFAYHFGFHSLVAWLHWWTGADVGALVSLAGHLVNAAVALGVAFFVLRLLGDGLVAGLAAWLVALLCVFPAYFANWGRFTQAGGLLLLPVAAALWIEALRPFPSRASARCPRLLLAAGLAASGLLLVHYRMAAVLLLLLGVWLLCAGAAPLARRQGAALAYGAWAGTGRGLLGAALAAALLALPWLAHLPSALALGLGERAGEYGAGYYALERLGTAPYQPTNAPLLLLGALGLALAWRRRAAGLLVLGAWAGLQLAVANPYWWPAPLPLVGRVDLVTVVATLCFPLAVAAAYALAVGWRAARQHWPRLAPAGAVALGLGGTLLGAWQLQALITPANALVSSADLAAATWLRASTPPDTRVAVSAVVFPWAADYIVGIDGGYWLPLLAGRATTVLPMLYAGERGADPQATREMVAVARALRDAPAAPETVALLQAAGVEYVYHSGRPGAPALDGALASPAYRLVYERDGVRILAVRPE